MIRLLRLLQGYVLFVAEGGFTERFLNLCKINGINLWNIQNDGVKVKAFTSAKDFKRINSAAERSAMSIKKECERGFKTFLTRNKYRVGVVVGLLLSTVVIIYLSGCVWNIEIQQKEGVKIEAFTNSLADLGVKTGARKSGIDILAVQEEMLRRHKELLWVSLNIFGGKAELQYTLVNEKTPSPETFLPTNLVARKNGVITLVECYQGTPLVKDGQYVAEGSILISGVLTNKDNTEALTQGMGKVFAKTQNVLTYNGGGQVNCGISGEGEPCYGIYFFGLNIPLGKRVDVELQSVTRLSLWGNKTPLPVGFVRYDNITFTDSDVKPLAPQIRLDLLLKCVDEKRCEYERVILKSVSYESNGKEDMVSLTAKITCVEDIAVEKYISVEKN